MGVVVLVPVPSWWSVGGLNGDWSRVHGCDVGVTWCICGVEGRCHDEADIHERSVLDGLP
jgi:hypothetical protein